MKKGIKIPVTAVCENKIISNSSIDKKMADKSAADHRCSLGIAVLKEFRRKGLGSIIMELLIEQARSVFKSEVIELTMYADNESAMQMYKKFGFREIGRIPKGMKYDDNKYVDEIIMIKELV